MKGIRFSNWLGIGMAIIAVCVIFQNCSQVSPRVSVDDKSLKDAGNPTDPGGGGGGTGGGGGGEPPICDIASGSCDGSINGKIYYLSGSNLSTYKALASQEKNLNRFFELSTAVPYNLKLESLAVGPRAFDVGFFDVDGNILKLPSGQPLREYFGFVLNPKIKLAAADQAGYYQLATVSDDGIRVSELKSDGTTRVLVSNEVIHSPRIDCSSTAIYMNASSVLNLEVRYFQGPANYIALGLMWRYLGPSATSIPASKGTCGFINDSDNAITNAMSAASPSFQYIPKANFVQ